MTKAKIEMMRVALEYATDSIIVTSPELDSPGPVILYVNPGFTSLTGYTAEEAVGRSPRFLQGPKTDRRVLQRVKNLLKQGRHVREEITNYRKDKKQYVIEWKIAPVKKGGRVVYWVSVQRDITERKRMENQLRRQKADIEKKVEQRTRELSRLKDKLQVYARKLELKVRKLEEKGLGLTDKERTVFSAMLARPNASDKELSDLTKVKRPTVTAIRRRLFLEKWLNYAYLPDFSSVGCQLAVINQGSLTETAKAFRLKEKQQEMPQTIFYAATNEKKVSVSLYRQINEAYEAEGTGVFGQPMYPLQALRRLFDYSRSLSGILGKAFEPEHNVKAQEPASDSQTTMLHTLAANPDAANADLASLAGVSVSTLIRYRKQLLDSGLLRRVVYPNIGKLGMQLLSFHAKTVSRETEKQISDRLRPFVHLSWKGQVSMLCLVASYEEASDLLEQHYRDGQLNEPPIIQSMDTRGIRQEKLDFSSILET